MRRSFIALALATALLAGCGGDDEEPATTPEPAAEATEAPADSGGGEAVKVSSPADGSLKFDQATLTAKAGKVTFTYTNPSQVPHAFEVEGNGVEEETETITEVRRLGHRRPRARHATVLLPRRPAPRGGDGGGAHGRVSA